MSVKLNENEVRGLRAMNVEEREDMIASTVARAHATACDYNVEAQTALTILVWKGIVTQDELREAQTATMARVLVMIEEHVRTFIAAALS